MPPVSIKVNMSTILTQAPRLLLVDSDQFGTDLLRADLEAMGCEVEVCEGGKRLERLLAHSNWDAILADQDTASLNMFARTLAAPNPPVLVIMAGFGSIDDAVEAVRAGAADFLTKPVSSDQVRVSLDRALEKRDLRNENQRLREEMGERFALGNLHSRSDKMRDIFEMVRNVADTRATILIEGESGTGKTLLARTIHSSSSRTAAPFVEVNCGALPDNLLESELFGHDRGAFTGAIKTKAGKFEAAHGGTIFLDEVSCASLDLQIKLLRVLQDREFEKVGSNETQRVDVRVIAATNQPLHKEVAEGRFREDLFYRLNVLGLAVPPLRERRGDVVDLAERFLARAAESYGRKIMGFEPRAMSALTSHSWPGNIRELENLVERAVLVNRGPKISLDAFPPEFVEHCDPDRFESLEEGNAPLRLDGRTLKQALEGAESALICQTLRENDGSRNRTALQLGINRTTLFNKMTKFALMDLEFDPEGSPSDETRA
jgi:DNA-binding NtrC family response regulator